MTRRAVRSFFVGIASLLALLQDPASAEPAEADSIVLQPGEQRAFDGKGIDSVEVSNPALVIRKITEDPQGNRQIILCGVSEGTAVIRLLRKGQLVRSIEVRVQRDIVALKKITCEVAGIFCPAFTDLCPFLVVSGEPLAGRSGSWVRIDTKRTWTEPELTGQISELETYLTLKEVREACPEIKIRVSIDEQVLGAVAALVKEKLRHDGLTGVTVVRSKGSIELAGTVADPDDLRNAEAVLRAYFFRTDSP